MNRSAIKQIMIVGLLLIASGSIGFGLLRNSQIEIESQKTQQRGLFKLRVSKVKIEALIVFPPSRYVIETSSDSNKWKVVRDWTQDDPWTVCDIQLETLSDQIGYFFRMSEYGVTVDKGKTWTFFEVDTTLARSKARNLTNAVPRVEIKQDGTGSIFMQNYYNRRGPTTKIYETSDFGRTWQLSVSD